MLDNVRENVRFMQKRLKSKKIIVKRHSRHNAFISGFIQRLIFNFILFIY